MVFHSSCMTNLKGFTISRPPLVVFTLCLTALAIATLSLARLVSQTESLPNPDVRLVIILIVIILIITPKYSTILCMFPGWLHVYVMYGLG
jgi:hypothetical protein